MNNYLTISELAERADIPNSTCRRYLANFEDFFVAKGGNRLKRYEAGSVDILKRIKDLYDNGMDTNEIYSVLAKEFPMVVTYEEKEEESSQNKSSKPINSLATSEEISEIKEELRIVREENENFKKLLQTISVELDKIVEQNDSIKVKQEEFDKRLASPDNGISEETAKQLPKLIKSQEEMKGKVDKIPQEFMELVAEQMTKLMEDQEAARKQKETKREEQSKKGVISRIKSKFNWGNE